MESFRIHILGCGSALPTLKHSASAQLIEMRGKCFMMDCGEGAQMQFRRSHVHFAKVSAIFISHLHGDHCFGLLGLLSTFGIQAHGTGGLQNGGALRHGDGSVVDGQRYHLTFLPPLKIP